jgi:hypothetical protein
LGNFLLLLLLLPLTVIVIVVDIRSWDKLEQVHYNIIESMAKP